ncbi:reverse transcriptase domain-containing protein [Tanacetum coccineum]
MPAKKTTTPMSDADIKQLIPQEVADALAEYEVNRSSRNGNDSHDSKSLTQWFEKMESVFHISNCTVACQIKFATCTLLGSALTWWNSHVKNVGHNAAYGMPWKTLKKMMTVKYYPRSEIKKLEIEIWILKVKGTDVVSYTQRFQELALMCGRMFLEESNEVEKYVGGLPDMIQGSVMASKPKTMQDEIEFENDRMDQKIHTFAERQAENKRKLDYNSIGHLARDCRSPAATANNQRAPRAIQRVVTCLECGVQRHYKKDYPKLKTRTVEIKLEMVKLEQRLKQWEMQG